MTRAIISILFFLLAASTQACAEDLEFDLFEGEFGIHGYKAGLLITNKQRPKWMADDGIIAGDLIVTLRVDRGEYNEDYGPTLNARKLKLALEGLPRDILVGFWVLKPNQKNAVPMRRPAQESTGASAPLEGVAEAYVDQSRAILSGKSVNFANEGDAYFAAIALDLLERCSLPVGSGDRVAVRAFVDRFGLAMTTSHYGDVGQDAGKKARQLSAASAGRILGKTLSCENPQSVAFANGLARSLGANENGEDGTGSRFVKSCTPWHDAKKCECLAAQARGVFENIHRMQYGREVIPAIVKSNPVAGIAIAAVCGIVRY